jgi:tRNA threonylcarbamoyladenosine biosynthesis protein TsaE
MAPFTYQRTSATPASTRSLAAQLGRLVAAGDVITLDGDLGAGKTCFVQGLARGMGLATRDVASPTFNIVKEHLPTRAGGLRLYHVDLYRIAGASELDELGMETYLYGDGVAAVEWMERFPSLSPPERLELRIAIEGPKQRTLTITGHGARGEALARAWLASTPKST